MHLKLENVFMSEVENTYWHEAASLMNIDIHVNKGFGNTFFVSLGVVTLSKKCKSSIFDYLANILHIN